MNRQVLDKYCAKKKLSNVTISAMMNRSPTWFSKVREGKMDLKPKYVEPLAKIFGISPDRLMKELFSTRKDDNNSSDVSKQ